MKKLIFLFIALVLFLTGGTLYGQPEGQKENPSGKGKGKGNTEFKVAPAKPQKMLERKPLTVEKFEVQLIAEGSHMGKPGDVLITFTGEGFAMTAMAPKIIIDKDLTLERAEINKDHTQLFVIIPEELMKKKLLRKIFKEVVVANPGGSKEKEFLTTKVKMTHKDLLEIDPKAKKARLIYKDYFFEKQDVNGDDQ